MRPRVALVTVALAGCLLSGQQSISGNWRWSCCGGASSGQFRIGAVAADGVFGGAFLGREDKDRGTISGRIAGEDVSFTRSGITGKLHNQLWQGRLDSSSRPLKMTGTFRDSLSGGLSAFTAVKR
jgi:hypothetical protein